MKSKEAIGSNMDGSGLPPQRRQELRATSTGKNNTEFANEHKNNSRAEQRQGISLAESLCNHVNIKTLVLSCNNYYSIFAFQPRDIE